MPVLCRLDPRAVRPTIRSVVQRENRASPNHTPRRPGVDDYLHEAALAHNPPSGTFYDPNHPTQVERLPSLGVHEHWNNAEERKYSRNLGKAEGIELISVSYQRTQTEVAASSGTP